MWEPALFGEMEAELSALCRSRLTLISVEQVDSTASCRVSDENIVPTTINFTEDMFLILAVSFPSNALPPLSRPAKSPCKIPNSPFSGATLPLLGVSLAVWASNKAFSLNLGTALVVYFSPQASPSPACILSQDHALKVELTNSAGLAGQ